MEVNVKVNVKEALNRFKGFSKELKDLCKKYDLEPEMAQDTETKDNFIVINVKNFIKAEDIKMSEQKEGD